MISGGSVHYSAKHCIKLVLENAAKLIEKSHQLVGTLVEE